MCAFQFKLLKHGAQRADHLMTVACNTSLGYTLSTATGTPKCINTSTGSSNCSYKLSVSRRLTLVPNPVHLVGGSVGNVCAGSYNGVGTKKCVSGICTLKCTTGTFV